MASTQTSFCWKTPFGPADSLGLELWDSFGIVSGQVTKLDSEDSCSCLGSTTNQLVQVLLATTGDTDELH
jgi:hypothetical protein